MIYCEIEVDKGSKGLEILDKDETVAEQLSTPHLRKRGKSVGYVFDLLSNSEVTAIEASGLKAGLSEEQLAAHGFSRRASQRNSH